MRDGTRYASSGTRLSHRYRRYMCAFALAATGTAIALATVRVHAFSPASYWSRSNSRPLGASADLIDNTFINNMSNNDADNDANNSANTDDDLPLQFGRFTISPSQIFHRSASNRSAALVNLRPIVPGHVLVISTRVVPRLADLSDEEYADLWNTVRSVQDMLARRHLAEHGGGRGSDGGPDAAPLPAFNVAVQDGPGAGQSVPHVHVHILPRIAGDFARNDDVYDELEAWAPRSEEGAAAKKQAGKRLEVLEDEDRRDRTMEQMADEADEYRKLMQGM